MKVEPEKLRRAVAAAVLAALFGWAGAPAAAERLAVPLTDPARPAVVRAAVIVGSIEVVAGPAGEVVVEAEPGSDRRALAPPSPSGPESNRRADAPSSVPSPRNGERATDEEVRRRREGLRRIPNPAFDLSATEEGNQVTVRAGQRPVDLRISVPAASSLQLSTVSGERIEVEGVTGELELHNTNGSIVVRGARGPVTANTVNGEIEVVLVGAPLPGPMAFSTLNGTVDVTLPAGAGADLRVRSDHGEIYSDFDVALAPEGRREEKGTSGQGRYRISVAKEMTGSIGGGGPEIFLKTFNGDVVLRQAQ